MCNRRELIEWQDAFVTAVQALKTADPLAPLTVLTPSNLLALRLRRAVAWAGRGHFGLRSLTLSDFAQWVFLLSTPLVAPFEHLIPALPYDGYVIDISTLISIVAYALAVTIVRQFLKVLVTK